MRTAYIAGPMRGYPMNNFPQFYAVESLLRKHGWNVINPASMDQQEGVTGDPYRNPRMLREVVKRDLSAIHSNLKVENQDAVVVLPHWQFSTGARAEHAVAEWLGLDILTPEEACDETGY